MTKACTLPRSESPHSASGDIRGRREPTEIGPRVPGLCDFCEGPAKRRNRFCSAKCRTDYWNLAKKRGAQIYEFGMRWRRHRGRKGTPGQGMIQAMASRIDDFHAEDREIRKQKGTKP